MKNTLLGFVLIFSLVNASFTEKQDKADYQVTVKANEALGLVSPNIMGFNIVYCYEGDEAWKSGQGRVPKMLNSIHTAQLRYPGGTVVTKYHWEKPTGQGWKDILDPQFDSSKNTDPSSFMDIDEYLKLTQSQKTEPLVGINMGSGMKYNRVQEGVDEAVRLMKHCLKQGVRVKYYYLDNEPYQHDANFTFTPEQYADMVNAYVPAMKKVDPKIKIIVNTHPRSDNYIKPLLEKAGKNIDLVDVHMYWKFKNATFENWKKESQMTHQNRGTYAEQNQIWQKVFTDAGYPNIKLVVLEWNIGPPGENTPPTETEAALMVSEQFAQYIKSGLFMSCFWPVSWPDKTDWTSRALFQAREGYKPNKMYNMFSYYSDVLGQQKVASEVSAERLTNLAVKSRDGKTLWVYLINKNQEKPSSYVEINIKDFKAKKYTLSGFESSGGAAITQLDAKLVQKDRSNYTLESPRNSFIKLTFKTN